MPSRSTKSSRNRVYLGTKYTSSQKRKHAAKRKKQAIVKNIQLIFERYRKKNQKGKKKKASLESLLEKYKGREDVLYKKVCEKYGVDPNPELLPKPKTRSKKRGVQFTWASRQEVLEEVILTYQYSIVRKNRKKGKKEKGGDKLNPLAVDKILNVIIEYAGSERSTLRTTGDTYDDPRATLFLTKPSQQELDEIWNHTSPNDKVNDDEFLVLIKNLVTLSRNHVLQQIQRQRLAVMHHRRQTENSDGNDSSNVRDSDFSERSDGDRFSDLWEAESRDSSNSTSRKSASSQRSLQELMMTITQEENLLTQRLKNAMRDDDRKSLSDISNEAPAVGSQNLSVEAGQIAVRCNRILGALMVDRERFVQHLKGISHTITRVNFYDVLHEILPNLSHELAEIQKMVPRRRASQGEGLKWQPPVSPLKRGDIPVIVAFEFSDLFKTELREQGRLMKQVEVDFRDSPRSPPRRQLTNDRDISLPLPLSPKTKRSQSLPLNSPSRKSKKKKKKANKTKSRASTAETPMFSPMVTCNGSPIFSFADNLDDAMPIDLPPASPVNSTDFDEDYLHHRGRTESLTDLPEVPSKVLRLTDIRDLHNIHPAHACVLEEFIKHVPKLQCLHLCDLICEFLPPHKKSNFDSEKIIVDDSPLDGENWDFAPINLRIDQNSNVRQVLEYTFTLFPALQPCEHRLKLLVMRNQQLITLDRESRFELRENDEISIFEDYT